MTPEELQLTDAQYQRFLQERLERTGALGDVFPFMVSRNVPQFLLKKLWPAMFAEFAARPHVIMFAAAEEGWRGRLDNIKARAERSPDGATFRITFRKTYVMECETLLVLARSAESLDDAVLVWLPKEIVKSNDASAGQTWTQRTEPGLSMDRSDGPPVHHYIVEGEVRVPESRVLRVDRRAYAMVATQLPRREITSMALLSVATLRRAGLYVSAEMLDSEARLLKARDGERLSGIHMKIAQEILVEFFTTTEKRGFALHPLWDRIRDMAAQAR